MKKIYNTLAITLLVASVSLPMEALADKGGNGKGHGKWDNPRKSKEYKHYKHKESKYRGHDYDDTRVVIVPSNRVVIREYIQRDYRFSCPPGLAMKRNGCTPPGHAKYVIGQRLPDYVVYQPLPDYVITQLEPVPYGYQYVTVDKDVLLINQASHNIVDAITLLSAVGN